MPYIFKHRRPPASWRHHWRRAQHPVLRPVLAVEWVAEWTAYILSRSSLIEVLEYAGSLSIIVGVVFYFAGANDRREQKHYQAWQVINTAHGKGGSGGRIDALEELNHDGVALVGVDVSVAFLQGVRLPGADLHRCNMAGADARNAFLSGANLEDSDLRGNFRGADLSGAHLARSNMTDADFNGADLHNADVARAKLDRADLRGANLAALSNWRNIESIRLTNVADVRNAPDGFTAWARENGAVETTSDDDWQKQIDQASPSTRKD